MDALLFFALPIATILLAIVWQKVVKCPILVALTAFAIFLIVTFAVFDSDFLIFAIVYTILAYIAAWLAKIICRIIGTNGVIRNITAENISTNTLSANTFEIDNNDDNHNHEHGCNNRYNRSFYRRF